MLLVLYTVHIIYHRYRGGPSGATRFGIGTKIFTSDAHIRQHIHIIKIKIEEWLYLVQPTGNHAHLEFTLRTGKISMNKWRRSSCVISDTLPCPLIGQAPLPRFAAQHWCVQQYTQLKRRLRKIKETILLLYRCRCSNVISRQFARFFRGHGIACLEVDKPSTVCPAPPLLPYPLPCSHRQLRRCPPYYS